MTNPSSGVFDFTSNVSGTANVKSGEDSREQQENRTQMDRFASGTGAFCGPDQVSAWYQSGTTANVPIAQVTTIHNTLYTLPPNSSLSPVQASGSANVPTSESSITH